MSDAFTPAAETWFAAIGLVVCLLALAAWAINAWARRCVDRMVCAALVLDDDDLLPTTDLLDDWLLFNDGAFVDMTPIFTDLSRERFVADALAEIDELTGESA